MQSIIFEKEMTQRYPTNKEVSCPEIFKQFDELLHYQQGLLHLKGVQSSILDY